MKNIILDILIECENFHRSEITKGTKRIIGEKADVVTEADIKIGDFIINKLLNIPFTVIIESEEHGKQRNFKTGNEDFYIAIDDIDGSNNLRVGDGFLPYCSMIVVFERKDEKAQYKFSDFKYAACIDYVSKTIFYTEKGLGKVEQYDLSGNKQKTSDENIQDNKGLSLTLGTDIVSSHRGGNVGYAASSSNNLPVANTLALQSIYRNFALVDSGCSVFEYAMVGMGIRDGYVSCGKKMHELPLLYAFCKETGKQLKDFRMNSFDEMIYDFNGKDVTVIAGDGSLIEQIHNVLNYSSDFLFNHKNSQNLLK